MKKLLLGAASAVVISSAAFAADVYTPEVSLKDSPVYELPYSWTGFYAGVHGGYAVGDWRGKLTYTGNGGDSGIEGNRSVNADGGFGGGQIGFNKQLSAFVIGLEADISGSGFEGKRQLPHNILQRRWHSVLCQKFGR
jgi:outer membrane immunogenic protein